MSKTSNIHKDDTEKEQYLAVLYHVGEMGVDNISIDYVTPYFEYPYLAGQEANRIASCYGDEHSKLKMTHWWYVAKKPYKVRIISSLLKPEFKKFFDKNRLSYFEKYGIL